MGVRLCVGLGNPGVEYAITRHNIGWLVVDSLLETLKSGASYEYRYRGMIWGPFDVEDEKVYLLKPLTFMNLSGRSVAQAARELEVGISDILIIYDDVDLPFGKLRLRAKGSAGGHKGMASVIAALGTLRCRGLELESGKKRPPRIWSPLFCLLSMRTKWSLCPRFLKELPRRFLLGLSWISNVPFHM